MTYKESLICSVTQGLMWQYRLHDDKAPELLANDVKRFVDAILSEMPEYSDGQKLYDYIASAPLSFNTPNTGSINHSVFTTLSE